MASKRKPPSYSLHKASGNARVWLNGQDVYLGEYRSKESLDRYDELIRQWRADQSVDKFALTVDDLCLKYLKHADAYYRKDGKPTSEPNNIRIALRYLIGKKGTAIAREFGPKALKEVRQAMIDAGCVRTSINRMVGRIKRVFKWGVAEELLKHETVAALDTVDGLRADRTDALESAPIAPVRMEEVNAVQPYVDRRIWAMIQLQLLTAARPGEVLIMRTCDLHMTGSIWEFRPNSHKTQHLNRDRVIFLGLRAQQIVGEFLKTSEPEAYLFSPAEAKAEFHANRKANRKTPMTPSQSVRKPKSNPQRKAGGAYTTSSYGQAIRKACEKAGVNSWHPHQLRHTKATEIRERFGLEAAQTILGHAQANVTQIYAERDFGKARQIIAELG